MHAVYQSFLSNPNKKRSESEYLTKTWVRASWSRILVIKSWNSDLIYSLVFSTHLKSISQFGSFPQGVKRFDRNHLLVDLLVYFSWWGVKMATKIEWNKFERTQPFSQHLPISHILHIFFLEKKTSRSKSISSKSCINKNSFHSKYVEVRKLKTEMLNHGISRSLHVTSSVSASFLT